MNWIILFPSSPFPHFSPFFLSFFPIFPFSFFLQKQLRPPEHTKNARISQNPSTSLDPNLGCSISCLLDMSLSKGRHAWQTETKTKSMRLIADFSIRVENEKLGPY